MEGRLTNHILAVRGSTLWNTLQSQNLSLITTNLNSYCQMFCWANFIELSRTPSNKLFSVSVSKPTSKRLWYRIYKRSNLRDLIQSRVTEERPRSDQGEISNEKLRNYNSSKIWCVKTVASPIKFKKSAKLALCVIKGSQKAKLFIFIKKDITIWLKLGRFVIVYDLTKWVKPFFRDFFYFSAFNRSGLI